MMTGARTTRRHAAVALSVAYFLIAAPWAAEAQRVEGAFQRSLTVSGGPDIDVTSGSGGIEVRTGPDGRIEVSARIRANDGWMRRTTLPAEERVRRIEANPPIEQNGHVIRLGHSLPDELREGLSISYTLTVPADSVLRSRTGSGSQQIEGVKGEVNAGTGSGSLTLRDIGGLRAATGSGSITADGVAGALHATTGSGSIRATRVNGAITAKTGSGGIEVEQAGSGDVDVSSGSGTVRLRGVRGGVRAATGSGGVNVEGQLAGDWRLSAASGSVRIALPPGQGFQLDAGTGSGRIDVGMPVTVTGTIDRRSLRGAVQGGGPLLHVRTSSGSIQIQ